MKVEYRFLLIIVILTLSVSFSEAATIAGGKYFSGQSFTSSIGGTFRIYGSEPYTVLNNYTGLKESHYRKATIMSDVDETISILNGTCESTYKYKYCYKGSMINFDDERTFQNSQVLAVMQVTIDSLPPPTTIITFTRNTTIKAYCGEIVTIPIVVKNSGTAFTDIVYTETLPINTVITSSNTGVISDNMITFKDKIPPNSSKSYSYTMINLDCESKKWIAQYTFTAPNGSVISKNITNLNITTQNAYKINETISVNKTNSLLSEIIYTWNITNTHPTIDLVLNMSMFLPGAGLVVTDESLGVSLKNGVYRYAAVLPVGGTQTVFIKFYALNYSNYIISTNMTVFVNEHEIHYTSNKTLQVLKPQVILYMDVNTTINKSMTVSVWAKNNDLTSKYYYLYGILKGFKDEEPLNYNIIEPDSTVLVGKKVYNTTGLGVQDYNLIFDGVYRDKDNKEYALYAGNVVTINSVVAMKSIISDASANPVIIPINQTTTKNITNITNTVETAPTTVPVEEKKKDFITRTLEALSEFLESIFG